MWLVWRLVLSRVATLEEIDRHFSIDDILDAYLLLEYKDKYQEYEMEKVRAKNGK